MGSDEEKRGAKQSKGKTNSSFCFDKSNRSCGKASCTDSCGREYIEIIAYSQDRIIKSLYMSECQSHNIIHVHACTVEYLQKYNWFTNSHKKIEY